MIFQRKQPTLVGLDVALESVSGKVRRAFELSHQRLVELGAPHVLIGGLAVGAHGYQYATKDVDWLVVQNDIFDGAAVITFKPGVPIQVDDVAVDYLTPSGPGPVVSEMQEALSESAKQLDRVVIASPELLVYMKLKAGRVKDVAAVVELVRAGAINYDEIFDFLEHTQDRKVVSRFQSCIERAEIDE